MSKFSSTRTALAKSARTANALTSASAGVSSVRLTVPGSNPSMGSAARVCVVGEMPGADVTDVAPRCVRLMQPEEDVRNPIAAAAAAHPMGNLTVHLDVRKDRGAPAPHLPRHAPAIR